MTMRKLPTDMKCLINIITIFNVLFPIFLFGQNNHLNFGIKENGICFGNSKNYTGIRFNFRDKNVSNINGLNISGQTGSEKMNGISFGLLASLDSSLNGLQIGFATGGEVVNGVSIAPAITVHEKINGLAISGIATWFKTTNGVQISLFGTTSFGFMGSELINGLGIGGVTFNCKKVNGVVISSILCYQEELNGVSIACFNATENLNGFQFGLWNYAANNRKLFRRLPIMNFNLRKKADNI